MEPLIIDYRKFNVTDKVIRIIIALYLLGFCGYFVFAEAAIDSYRWLFFTASIGALVGLLLLLLNTLWESNKRLLLIDELKIESNIKPNKFKIDWLTVSNVKIYASSIYIYIDGGRKERIINLGEIHLKDVDPIKNKIIEICKYKSIAYTNE